MVKEVEEENKSTKHEFIPTNPDWLDLPEPIATNIILENLEAVDYIRFSAVCKKWYSIQKEHRIRYYPYPPPLLLPFPWLRSNYVSFIDGDSCIPFYLPAKQKWYKIPFLRTSGTHQVITKGHDCFVLLFLNPSVLHIVNPITSVEIKLPPCSLSESSFSYAHISSTLTDPDCTLLTVNSDREVYLYQVNNNCGWKKVDGCSKMHMNAIAFCNNKFFRMCVPNDCPKMLMIDTLLPEPVEQMIKMDCSEVHAVLLHSSRRFAELVDFFGELVMIVIVYEFSNLSYDIKEFHVYRADFSTNKWVRMETLGDGVLFYSSSNTFALRAADVGCKKNAIYPAECFIGPKVAWRGPWKAFDISTRDWIDVPLLSLSDSKYHSGSTSYFPSKRDYEYWDIRWSWFLPTLNYFSGAKTNGNCQNICLDA